MLQSEETNNRKRLAILMNDLPPYRVPIYQRLQEDFSLKVLLSGVEDNRRWNAETASSNLDVKRSWGVTRKKVVTNDQGEIHDLRYTHVTLGLILDLIRFRPHAIISTEMGFRSLVAVAYGVLFKVPVWIWWGGTLHTERFRSRLKNVLRTRVFARFVQHWISYGKSSSEYLQSIGVHQDKVLEVQNSARFDENGKLPSLKLPELAPRILYVGQLIARKGINELIAAARRAEINGLEFSLILVGDGPEAANISRHVSRSGLRSVTLNSYVSADEIFAYYRECDVLIFPTLEDVWGLVVNEALSCGIPVFVSKFAGSAHELAHSEDIFDPTNEDEMDDVFRRIVAKEYRPPPTTKLWPNGAVCDAISNAVSRRLKE